MKQECKACGEVLFGAVNRCWKCGAEVEAAAADSQTPPVCRAPVDLDAHRHFDPDLASPDLASPIAQVLLSFPSAFEISEVRIQRCAVASVAVGTIGCIIGLVTGWTITLGITGIVLGMFGMQGKQRDLATMGLVLSVVAFFLGFGQIGFDVWTRYATRRWIEELQGVGQ